MAIGWKDLPASRVCDAVQPTLTHGAQHSPPNTAAPGPWPPALFTQTDSQTAFESGGWVRGRCPRLFLPRVSRLVMRVMAAQVISVSECWTSRS